MALGEDTSTVFYNLHVKKTKIGDLDHGSCIFFTIPSSWNQWYIIQNL